MFRSPSLVRCRTLVALAAVLCAAPASARAGTIDFASLCPVTGGFRTLRSPLTVGGFQFTPAGATGSITDLVLDCPGAGALLGPYPAGVNGVLIPNGTGQILNVAAVGGGTFSVTTLTLGQLGTSNTGGVGTTVLATGTIVGGGTVTQTLTLPTARTAAGQTMPVQAYTLTGFSAVTGLRLEGVQSDVGLTSLDAVGATSTVPEPSTWALLGTGLGALGLVARRRRATA